jgi:hypothetical protein
MVKVIGFRKDVVDNYIKEVKEVEDLDKEFNKPRVFGWTPTYVKKRLNKARKWVTKGWYSTPHMRLWLEQNDY